MYQVSLRIEDPQVVVDEGHITVQALSEVHAIAAQWITALPQYRKTYPNARLTLEIR